jgi:hypothetical protein
MSQQEGAQPTGGASGEVQQEQSAFIQEAEQAKAAFAGAADVPGGAGAVESDADAPLSAGQTQTAGETQTTGVDTGAPERAREGAEGGGGREYEEPSTGQMLASELSSEPSMQAEGTIAEKLTGSEGETTGTEKA